MTQPKEHRAFTKDQKKAILIRFYRLWLKHPDLRFSQLVENLFHHDEPNHCFYHIEDFPLIEKLEKFYGDSDTSISQRN